MMAALPNEATMISRWPSDGCPMRASYWAAPRLPISIPHNCLLSMNV